MRDSENRFPWMKEKVESEEAAGRKKKEENGRKRAKKDTPMDTIQKQKEELEKTRQELKADKAKRDREEQNARGKWYRKLRNYGKKKDVLIKKAAE